MASKTVQLREKKSATEYIDLIPSLVKNAGDTLNPHISIYGVRINMADSNPNTAVVYTDDAVGFTPSYMDFSSGQFKWGSWQDKFPFNQIRPCLLKKGEVVTYLDPNDFTKDIEGNFVNTTISSESDVMIEIPKIYYYLYKDENYQYIKISKKRYAGFCCLAHTYKGVEKDFIYIGAYQATIDSNNKLRSVSGGNGTGGGSNTSFSVDNQGGLRKFREAAHNHKDSDNLTIEGYEELWWQPLTLLQALFLIQFKNLNSQAVMGYGWVDSSNFSTCGGLNDKGMNYCASGTANAQMKWLGIEDFWGSRATTIDGARLVTNELDTNKADLKVINPNNDMNFKNINGYETAITNLDKNSGEIQKIVSNNQGGFCPTQFNQNLNYDTYFCDWGKLTIETGILGVPCFGGNSNLDGSKFKAGNFYMSFKDVGDDNASSSIVGGRLFYCSINNNLFAETSWERINNIIQQGNGKRYFSVGDEKNITLNNGEVITLQILGFDHDNLADETGKAGVTIGMKNLLATKYQMNTEDTNVGGWGGYDEATVNVCKMRVETMTEYYGKLPADLQSVIKIVEKDTTVGSSQITIQTSHDKLFLFSRKEILNTEEEGYAGEGTQYEYWNKHNTANDRIKKLSNGTGQSWWWWLRSPNIYNTNSFNCIDDYGGNYIIGASFVGGVCFGFCI